jgi:LmbE family N-acetylglucosaminyl deacetylase
MSGRARLLDFPPAARVVVVAPHPDDEVLACGGAIALHRMQGDEVLVLVVFDGALGAGGAGRREAECRAAARELLEPRLEFWRLPEGHAPSDHDHEHAVRRLASLFAEFEPELVYAPWEGDDHPDHRVVARVVRDAVASHSKREGVRCTLLGCEVWSDLAPDLVLDTSAAHEHKLRALACHESQLADGALEAACRARMERRARAFGGRALSAEAFVLVQPERG